MEYFRLTIAFFFCILIQGSFQEENEQRDGKGTLGWFKMHDVFRYWLPGHFWEVLYVK